MIVDGLGYDGVGVVADIINGFSAHILCHGNMAYTNCFSQRLNLLIGKCCKFYKAITDKLNLWEQSCKTFKGDPSK